MDVVLPAFLSKAGEEINDLDAVVAELLSEMGGEEEEEEEEDEPSWVGGKRKLPPSSAGQAGSSYASMSVS